MREGQRVIKYIAIIFACFLVVSIFTLIIRGVMTFSFIFSDNKEYDYTTVDQLDISKEVDKLVLDIAYSDLNIKVGDKLKVDTNNQYIRVTTSNNKLIIKEEKHSVFKKDKKDITIYIPEDYIFTDVDMDTGAGRIKIDSLTTEDIDVDFGAGTVFLDNITVLNKADIETGAGKVTINNSVFNNLDFDCGVGKVVINAEITGNSTIDAGVGALTINLLGNRDNYRIIGSKGIGTFKLNGDSIADNTTYGEGRNSIKISGGVGTIKVNFENSNDTYIKTYTVLNKVSYQEENKYYVTLQEFQGSVETVIIEDKENILEEDKTYAFKFIGNESISIKDNFKNELIEFRETDKIGLDQNSIEF